MSAFTKRGGKLILYQGWGEPGIPPANLVRYYGDIHEKDERYELNLYVVGFEDDADEERSPE